MAFKGALLASMAAQASAVWLGGVNIAGCDFGVDTSGNYQPQSSFNGVSCPSKDVATQQMTHFSQKDGFNVFRLPVAWQALVNNDLTTNKLDETFMTDKYDPIVQACLATGAHCIIDIHNYARWWGQIVGQGGPASSSLATTWEQLADRYKGNDRIIYGVMNEPHDLDMDTWATTVQDSVTAIRNAAGSTGSLILLSGTNFDNAGSFPTASGPALQGVKNPDGSTTNLIFEVHQYLDEDYSGTHTSCTHDVSASFNSLATYLRGIGRQAMLTEIGGGNGQDCISLIGSALDVLNKNGDVFLGWTSWAAGSFPSTYELSEVPDGDTDVGIVASAFAPKFKAGNS